jgi:hypothetical protein
MNASRADGFLNPTSVKKTRIPEVNGRWTFNERVIAGLQDHGLVGGATQSGDTHHCAKKGIRVRVRD